MLYGQTCLEKKLFVIVIVIVILKCVINVMVVITMVASTIHDKGSIPGHNIAPELIMVLPMQYNFIH